MIKRLYLQGSATARLAFAVALRRPCFQEQQADGLHKRHSCPHEDIRQVRMCRHLLLDIFRLVTMTYFFRHFVSDPSRWSKSTFCASTRSCDQKEWLRCSSGRLPDGLTCGEYSKPSTLPASSYPNLLVAAGLLIFNCWFWLKPLVALLV